MTSLRAAVAAVSLAAAACGPKSSPPMTKPTPPSPAPVVDLATLTEGQKVAGFTAVTLYLDGEDKPIGGRFRHDQTGFLLDLVQIESAPQAFVWINTFPTSDQGEPHTQEHLLLGKGTKGRTVASLEAMSLAESSAFTAQWRTCYHFHTIAGPDVFWNVFAAKMSGLLEPDYTDEEIRREVRNFGVAEDAASGALKLEEKGTVYQEMVRSFENPGWPAWRELNHMLYGPTHPLALVSGGLPAAIRTMTAQDIRTFHHQSHHLANMGMVAAFPRTMPVGDVLARTDAVLLDLDRRLDKNGRVTKTEADLPAPRSAPPGDIRIVPFPDANPDKPADVTLAWPPTRDLDVGEQTLLQMFLANLAGDETTNLYKKLIDSSTRTVSFGATGVGGSMSSDQGQPIYITLSDVEVAHLDAKGVAAIRTAVMDELKRVAGLPDGSPELAAFNERMRNRIIETRRGLAKFLNSPPGFGFRGIGSEWMDYLHSLERSAGFKKSLTLAPQLAAIEKQLDPATNVWRTLIPKWGLLETPYGVAGRADPGLMAAETAARDARLRAELDRAKQQWGLADDKAALDRYKKEYDAKTVELDAAARAVPMPRFIDTPPMTEDDALVWDRRSLPRKVPFIASTFQSMTGGTAGLAFDLRGLPEEQVRWLGVLPMLLTDVGVIENGVPIPYDQMRERQRKEILSVSVGIGVNVRSGRAELVARGSGNDPEETERAIGWIELVLQHPDWREANLPRIRDLVDQSAQGIRNRMQGAEEYWADDPPAAWWKQQDPLLARTTSFLTRTHDLHRLRWLLRDPATAAEGRAVTGALAALAKAGQRADRAALAKLLADHKPGASKVVDEAVKDLVKILPDLPDASLHADFAYLCKQIADDYMTPAAAVLADVDKLRARILTTAGARAFAIGSAHTLERIQGRLGPTIEKLADHPVGKATYAGRRYIVDRLRARGAIAAGVEPVFVGLVNPNTQTGIHVHSAPGPFLTDTDDDSLMHYLAGNLYTGHGAHSIFMKTWAAGLAYSNGLRPSIRSGRVLYYAERCPELP
ncbi:MAG TPA: hypothetical protein VL172_07635, partial [Kofleriaceae bacterium]|nr:hypothetical protein [Kofleriaceae bacterium]